MNDDVIDFRALKYHIKGEDCAIIEFFRHK